MSPGPWKITGDNSKEVFVEGNVNAYERLFCAVSIDDCCVKTGKQNARAITALPEAFAVIQEFLGWGAMTSSDVGVFRTKFEKVLKKAGVK